MIYRIKNKFNLWLLKRNLRKLSGFMVGNNLVMRGCPLINIENGGSIVIKDNVVLNSINISYHVNMFAPVKLFADRQNAKIEIGSNTRIHGSCIHAYNSITIGNNCLIAANCQIFDGSGHDLCLENPSDRINTIGDAKPIIIADNVWIGANCIILPGVNIGEGSVIAAGSVVVKDIPKRVLAAGNPAKIIKEQTKETAI